MRKFFLILLTIGSLIACHQSQERQIQGYVEGENIYLASPYSGILETLAVQRGQMVKKGDLLFQLDKNPEFLQIKQFEADLQQAKNLLKDLENPRRKPEIAAIQAQIEQTEAQIKLAEVRVRRYQELYRKQAASKDVLDEAVAVYQEQVKLKEQYESNLRLARLGSREEQINAQKAQIASFAERLSVAKWQLEQKRLYAPADGLIFDTYYRVGEFVGSQKAVLSLLTPANVRIEFFVPVELLAALKVGQKIEFLCDGCRTRAQALISYISPEAQYIPPLVYSRENTDKLVFRIKADLREFNEFKPGQPVTVFIP
ncbi:HlyD family secretion protein [Legionella genomosp. 1]|uniref:HlyD family secretion protein n=1 Tax=Legionella genomosp. 1 TaxID=1093625 RepID=UPI001056D9A0|nr:HlyD family efflux transporter periplasmic adaptor subunit [Legionella genomosp. 1]